MELVSKISNPICDPDPPTSQTDGQTTCNRKTALCTIVHRAVKTLCRLSRNAPSNINKCACTWVWWLL